MLKENFSNYINILYDNAKKMFKDVDFIKVIMILFFLCAFSDYFIFVYNVITVVIKYGIFNIWQPVVTNADKVGMGTIYYLLAVNIKKNKEIIF